MSNIAPEDEPQILPRNPFARPGAIPDWRLEGLYLEQPPSKIVARAEESSTSSSAAASTSCGKNDNSGACEKYYGSGGSSTTLPIVLGVLIPLGIALILLAYLHRRHVNKLRREDAEDKHKALDFGLEVEKQNGGRQKGKKFPEMSMGAEKEMGIRRERGMSLDLGPHSPYLLPPELQSSRDSLRSLSRNINPADDPYRATSFIPDDGSIRPPSSIRGPFDDSSSYTGSSSLRFQMDSRQNMLRTDSPGMRNASLESTSRKPLPPTKNNTLLAPAPAHTDGGRDSVLSTNSFGAVNAIRASNNYLGQYISGGVKQDLDKKEPIAIVNELEGDSPVAEIQPPPPAVIKNVPTPLTSPRLPEIHEPTSTPDITLNAPEERQPRLPQLSFIESQNQPQTEDLKQAHNTASFASKNPHHSTAPSAYSATEQPSKRQSVQSTQQPQQETEDDYYDEYEAYGEYDEQYDYAAYTNYADEDYMGHDNRRSMMGMRPLPPDDPSENPEQRANRIRSFYKEYFEETKGQNHGQHPQYYDGAEDHYYDDEGIKPHPGYYDQGYQHDRGMSQAGGYGRHRATISQGSFQSAPAGRAYSSASGRYGQPRMPPKKKLPPPKALHLLPTPHKLKEDTFIPIDFAPPKKFSNQRSGTPDSPRGGMRPYSPGLKANILASSFDDLAVMPSPHQLRKSSTFTALDFAPPGRLRANGDNMSETGSIRSNRSGLSAMHHHNIRAGAYRVSRIPKEVAGTRDELSMALRPQWDMKR